MLFRSAGIGGIESRVQALLSSAEELVAMWETLEPGERKARLREVVSEIVVNKVGSPGEANQATICFSGVFDDGATVRVGVGGEVSKRSRNAARRGFPASSGAQTDVSHTAGSPYWTSFATTWPAQSARNWPALSTSCARPRPRPHRVNSADLSQPRTHRGA